MDYQTFVNKIQALINEAGGEIPVEFRHATDEGKHYAYCGDGTVITGNLSSRKITVRWNGRNHMAMAEI